MGALEALADVGVGDGSIEAPPASDVRGADAIVPVDPEDGVQLALPDGRVIGLGLPAEGEAVGGLGDGLLYRGVDDEVQVAAETLGDGMRALVVLEEGASTEHRFPLALPDGAIVEPRDDGGYDVDVGVDGVTVTVATIEAPWATDGAGRSVPTRYHLEGDVLVQEVDHAGATYPVVADPSVSFGWYVYVKFNRNETLWVGRAKLSSKAAFVSTVCYPIPHPGAKAACAAIATTRWVSILNTFEDAAARAGRCVELKFTYVPQVLVGWKGVSC